MNFLAQKRRKVLLDTSNTAPSPATPDSAESYFYKEIAKLTGTGAWSVDFKLKKTFVDEEARRLLEIPANYHISLRNAINFYAEEHHDKVNEMFFSCLNGNYATTTVRMRSMNEREFWVRATAEPIFNDKQEVVGIRGVFQNIHNDKQKELHLIRSLKTIESQNTQLNNFANIISHSLRSHASNLKMTVELLNDSEEQDECQELARTIKQISDDINTVIGHVGELGVIQVKSKQSRKPVRFDKVLEQVKYHLQHTISDTNTEILSDFSELPEIDYIPAYMESIFMNLITNAIKYASPDRKPVIETYSYTEGDDEYLMVKDNGQGVDLEKFGNRIFNMYQTFHKHKDAEGIGLFLLKNRIESLQGSITVQSEPDKGTVFTIRF